MEQRRDHNRGRHYHAGIVPSIYGSERHEGICIHAEAADVGAIYGVVNENGYVALAANDTIEVVSSNAADTSQWVTLYSVNLQPTGHYLQAIETKKLNGTTAVAFSGTAVVLLQGYLSAKCAGTITFRRQTGATTVASITSPKLSTNILHWYGADQVNYRGLTVAGFEVSLNTRQGDLEMQIREYPEATDARDLTLGFHPLTTPIKTDLTNGVVGITRINQNILEHAESGSYVCLVARGYSGSSLYAYSDCDASLWMFMESA